MTIGEGFQDDLGFVRRTGVTRQFYDVAFMPQPRVAAPPRHPPAPAARARVWIYYDPHGDARHATGHAAMQIDVEQRLVFRVRVRAARRGDHDAVQISPGRGRFRPGRYDWTQHLLLFEGDHSRALSGSIRYTFGDFWSGTQKTAQISVLYRPNYRLMFDLGLQVSDIDLQVPDEAVHDDAGEPADRATPSAPTCSSTRCCNTATT